MKVFSATIEGNTRDGFWVYSDEELCAHTLNGHGATIEEAKQDIEEYAEYILKEETEGIPDELKDGYTFKYKMTVEAFLSVFTPVLGKKGIERLTGISNKQLWKYQNGTEPRQAQIKKMQDGLFDFAKELSRITLVD